MFPNWFEFFILNSLGILLNMGVPNEIFKLQYNSVHPLNWRICMSCAICISIIWGICCQSSFRCLFKHILLEVKIRLQTGVMNNSCMTCSKSKSNTMHPKRWFNSQWISDKPIFRLWSLSVFLILSVVLVNSEALIPPVFLFNMIFYSLFHSCQCM